MRCLIIRQDTVEVTTLPDTGELDFLQATVGGYVEALQLGHPETGSPAVLWLGEEAKAQGHTQNVLADVFATYGGWQGRTWGDWIAGTVVLTGLDPDEGESIDLPDEWVALANKMGGDRNE